jgi:hypothetical protein
LVPAGARLQLAEKKFGIVLVQNVGRRADKINPSLRTIELDESDVCHVDNRSAPKFDQIFVHRSTLLPTNLFGNRNLMNATAAQLHMLFRLWRVASRLISGDGPVSKDEHRRLRMEFTKKILGVEKSWSRLNRRSDVDFIRGALLAVLRPGDPGSALFGSGSMFAEACNRSPVMS